MWQQVQDVLIGFYNDISPIEASIEVVRHVEPALRCKDFVLGRNVAHHTFRTQIIDLWC